MHINIGVFGDQELAKKLGKKDTSNDISIYSHSSSEGIYTFICPNSEKVQPLLQVLNMIDVPVLVVRQLTKEIGEMIIGINEMNFEKGFIITAENLGPLIKGTSLEKFKAVAEDAVWSEILKLSMERKEESVSVPIDNYFNVKGIGTVILGIVQSGKVRLHDELLVEPLGKKVVIKGIQSHDKDILEAEVGTRVGLNLKGVEVDDLKRGFVIGKEMKKSSELKIKFSKSRFFRQEINPGMQIFLSVGLQVATCIVESVGDELKLKSNQDIAYKLGQRCIVASQNDILPRIVGSGVIL
ncbi:MAG: EF-Tu/IF-2/RF-3 family GTPase [Candidatus Aenigmatarchaeota archaeon]